MPLPKLDDDQVAWIVKEVATYIQKQRQLFIARAVHLNPNQKAALQSLFPASALDSARVVVLTKERVPNPYFYAQLLPMGESFVYAKAWPRRNV